MDELDRRRVDWTATDAYSRILLETRAHPRVLLHYAGSFVRVARELAGVIRRHRIDLVHTISYPASLYAAFAARWCGIPQVWQDHNIKRIHRVNRHLYQFVARSCPAVIGVSEAVTANLARAGIPGAKLQTVYNGIDLARFEVGPAPVEAIRRELGLGSGAPAVGLFGQMLPYKGHRTLIAAAAAILRAEPRARFFFVGALENPPYQAELRSLINAGGLDAAFSFCGWRRDIPAVLRAMDVVAVLTATPEPAALGLMEAMAAGRPVVATRTGGTPEIVVDGETGLLVPPGEPEDTANAIAALLRDETRRAMFGAAGRRRVEERFGLDRHLRAMERIYRDACASRDSTAVGRASS